MRIFITGGLGFQGTHLTRRLLQSQHEVIVLVSPRTDKTTVTESGFLGKVEFVSGDILDRACIASVVSRVDLVVHLAGKINPRESLVEPYQYTKINVEGTLTVLEAVRQCNTRLIYVSSCAVYGDGAGLAMGESFSETSPLVPVDPYAASKVAADRLCYAYHRSYGLDITILRPFSTYGPGQMAGPYGGLIPNLTARAKQGESLIVYGDGSAVRDFIYIDDLVDAYELIVSTSNLAGETFNVASGRETTVLEVVSYIADRFGVPVEFKPANHAEVRRYAANISKIQALGFSPKVLINKGLDNYFATL